MTIKNRGTDKETKVDKAPVAKDAKNPHGYEDGGWIPELTQFKHALPVSSNICNLSNQFIVIVQYLRVCPSLSI